VDRNKKRGRGLKDREFQEGGIFQKEAVEERDVVGGFGGGKKIEGKEKIQGLPN